MHKDGTKGTLLHWHDFRMKLILESILVGFLAGGIVIAYRFAVDGAHRFSQWAYAMLHDNPTLIPLWLLFLVSGGLFIGWLIQQEPMASGSGIPQVEGVLLRKLNMRWGHVLAAKFLGGVVSICAGLSLGREGPSIQMGAAVGMGFSRLFRQVKLEEKFLMTSGASAGLSAAFNAPIAGVMFALEEVHKNFSPIVMVSALAASVAANFISGQFFGMKPVFNFRDFPVIPLRDYGYVLLLGIVMGLWGLLFNRSLLKTQDLYAKMPIPPGFKPVVGFLAAGAAGFYLPQILGGGHDVVESFSHALFPLQLTLTILAFKFLFTMVSYGTGAPGGIFLPLLVVGALSGVAYGDVVSRLTGLEGFYVHTFMILAMAAYFTAIVKAPITGIILIVEMTGSFSHLLAIAVVCLTAYIVVEALDSPAIYEALLHKLLQKGGPSFRGSPSSKVLIESAVCLGSIVDGRRVMDMDWPPRSLLVAIKRGAEEIIPKGDTVIHPGDYLIVLANEDEAAEIRECVSGISENFSEEQLQ